MVTREELRGIYRQAKTKKENLLENIYEATMKWMEQELKNSASNLEEEFRFDYDVSFIKSIYIVEADIDLSNNDVKILSDRIFNKLIDLDFSVTRYADDYNLKEKEKSYLFKIYLF